MDQAANSVRSDERVQRILDAALMLIMRYGYNRITMDDIANEAGMSRPALYQHFRNKKDIYRASVASAIEAMLRDMGVVLAGEEALGERLFKAIKYGLLDKMAEVEASPHGAEMLEMKMDFSADLMKSFCEGKVAMFAKAFGDADVKDGFEPEMLAHQLVDWLEGMKGRTKDPAEREQALRGFVDMQMRALGVN